MNGTIISFLRRTKSDISLSEFELFECNNTSDLKYNRPSLAMCFLNITVGEDSTTPHKI